MDNKTLKIVISLIIAMIMMLLFTGNVQADFEIYEGEVHLTGGRLAPQFMQGEDGIFYCIWGHGAYKASMPRGYTEGETRGPYKGCSGKSAPWEAAKISMEYTRGAALPMQDFQDAAYILAFGDHSLDDAYAIWSSTINFGHKEAPNALGQEAAAYKAFYESIHSLNQKQDSDDDDDDDVKVGEYALPTTTDVHRISVQDYNDDLRNVEENDFVNNVTEKIRVEWLNNYNARLTENQINRVKQLATNYYSKKMQELNGYPLPGVSDIDEVSDEYYDKIILESIYVAKPEYITNIYNQLVKKWRQEYSDRFTDFTAEEQIKVKEKIGQYYDANLAKSTGTTKYPFPPSASEIADASKSTREKVEHAGRGSVSLEEYIDNAMVALQTFLYLDYRSNYTTEEKEYLKEEILKPYYEENFAKKDQFEEFQPTGYSSNKEVFEEQKLTYVPYSNMEIKKTATVIQGESDGEHDISRAEIRSAIKRIAYREFYDEDEHCFYDYEREEFANEMIDRILTEFPDEMIDTDEVWELALRFYDTNIAKSDNPGQIEEPDDDFDNEYEEGQFLEDDFDDYYDNYDYDDDNYYDTDDEYPEPSMNDVHRIALREYYDDSQKTYKSDIIKEDFVYMISIYIEDEWWEKYEAELDHVDRDRVARLAEQYYDTYIRGGQSFDESQYRTNEPTMEDIDKAAKEGGYTSETGKDNFINNVTRDVANNWIEEYGVSLTEEQSAKVRRLAEQYYDKYIAKNVEYENGHTDQFVKLVKEKTNTDDLKVRLTKSTSTYVVGPFKVEYPSGNYGGINKFSWITNVRITDQNGLEIGNVEEGTLEIVDKNGNLIYDTNRDGSNLNVPRNGEEFYLRFHSRTALNISVTLDFKYLESIDAEAYRYEGRFMYWFWEREELSRVHKETYEDRKGKMRTRTCCNYYNWKLRKVPAASSQLLMDVMHATPVYAEESFTLKSNVKPPPPPTYTPTPTPTYTPTPTPTGTPTITTPPPPPPSTPPPSTTPTPTPPTTETPPPPTTTPPPDEDLDMTMAIEGKVFLDQDAGKTNTGNNEYDNGEQLEGVDVWLYKKDGTLVGVTLTDSNGRYRFEKLNAMDEYYVQFVYNGMLYTNVDYKENGENASKATETAHNHPNNRTDFNNKFKEIGSEPANYETQEWIRGALGIVKNKVYNQEEVVELFKEVAKAMAENVTTVEGDQVKAYQAVASKHASDPEIWKKLQFVADIRMKAYTVTNYSRFDSFIISDKTETIGDTTYREIYYEQYYVNLGIKARPTFDLALYKDVLKAEVQMNGKTETYTYDKRVSNGNAFSIGVSEADYLNGIRGAYIQSQKYANEEKNRELEPDTYDLNMRSEEVANGQSSNYNVNVTGKVNRNYQLNNNYDNLTLNGANKDDRLKIYVTYKLAVRNQSGITGAITELVDYFDPNYTFVDAFVGDKNGNKVGNVIKSDSSMYGNESQYKNSRAYTTVYLRPERETRLHNDNKEQYIYVVLQLLGPNNDAGTLLSSKLLNKNELSITNVAEINGYKTYDSTSGNSTPGLIDIDSTPGNLDLTDISELTTDELKKHEDTYEDDTSKAPALIYKLLDSRTIEGKVFEDATGKGDRVYTGQERKGNGKLDNGEKGINGVIVQLVEIKNGEMFVRSTTRTNADGWYGFTGFLPGNYTIRYIYGADDETAMTTTSKWIKGKNETSYNGQDYQSTIFGVKQGVTNTQTNYKTDADLINRYRTNYNNKNAEESAVNPNGNTTIRKYQDGYYWYTITDDNLSDAKDDEYRRQQVINYARHEYIPQELTYENTAVANHKAEVFNSYGTTQPSHISQALNRELANELERRTYRFAYTAEMPIEVEYAVQTIAGTGRGYEHKITNVDFGIVERPRAKIELTKNVAHIKVTTTDGTVLFNTNKSVENLSWTVRKDRYKAQPPIQIIMDEELISGSTVEITYKITVSNNGEKGESAADGENGEATTTMKRILDYVDNSLNFNIEDNLDANGQPLWKVVTVDDMQNATNATFINNSPGANNLKMIDLSTQQTLLQTTPNNPLSKALKVGETAESTVTLRKVLAAESDTDQLTYDNIMETIEIDNEVGRYDHESVPGNQDPEKEPTEDDTFRSERVVILPPFGAKSYYFIAGLGIAVLAILGVGVFVIKKYVVDKKS